MKKTFSFLLLVVILSSFAMAVTEYTPTSEKTCNDGVCSLTMYASPVFENDGGQWKRMNQLTRLDWSAGAFNFSYKEDYWVEIEPYFIYNGNEKTLNEAKLLYPSLNYALNKETFQDYHKFAPSVSGIPASLNNSNLQFGMRLRGSGGLSWNDIQKEKDGIVIKNKIRLDYTDLIGTGFTIDYLNKTHIIIGNISGQNRGGTVVLDPTLYINRSVGGILDDTWIGDGVAAGTTTTDQWGDHTYLYTANDNTNGIFQPMMKFNISNVTGPVTVLHAYLNYSVSYTGTYTEEYNYSWHLVYNNFTIGGTDSWCEGEQTETTYACGVSWSVRPKAGAGYVMNQNGSVAHGLIQGTGNSSVSYDLASVFQYSFDNSYNVTSIIGEMQPTDGTPPGAAFNHRVRPKEVSSGNALYLQVIYTLGAPTVDWEFQASATDTGPVPTNTSADFDLNVTQLFPSGANRTMTHGVANLYIDGEHVGNGTQTLQGTNGTGYLLYNLTHLMNVTGSLTYSWNVTAYFNDSSVEYNNYKNGTIDVIDMRLANCTEGQANTTIKFNFKQENVSSLNQSGTMNLELNYRVNDITNGTFNAELGPAQQLFICTDNVGVDLTTDLYATYTTPGGFTHRFIWYNQVLNSDDQLNVTLYNWNDTVGKSNLKLTVRLPSYSFYENVVTSLERWYVDEGVWRVVQMDESDSFGQVFFNVVEESVDYRLIFRDHNNNLLKRTTKLKFICNDGNCDTNIVIDPDQATTEPKTFGYAIDYDNATKIVTIDWTDTYQAYGTNVQIITSQESSEGRTNICSTQQTGYSGTATCDLTGYSGSVMTRIYASGDVKATEFIDIGKGLIGELIPEKEASFWTWAISLTAIGFGAVISPVVGLMALGAALVFVFFIGLFTPINMTILILYGVMTIIIGVKIRT